MNLLPVPLLDGGHLMFYAFEAVRGRPLSERMQEIGLRIGIALVALLLIFTTSHDILAPRVERQLTMVDHLPCPRGNARGKWCSSPFKGLQVRSKRVKAPVTFRPLRAEAGRGALRRSVAKRVAGEPGGTARIGGAARADCRCAAIWGR